jgi:PKD repeat protein
MNKHFAGLIMALVFCGNITAQNWYNKIRYTDSVANIEEIKREFEAYNKLHPEEEGEIFEEDPKEQFLKRWLEAHDQFTDKTGNYIAPQWTVNNDREFIKNKNSNMGLRGTGWYEIGPTKVDYGANGLSYAPGITRFNTVEQDPVNPNIVYAGTAVAGLWKTTDNGNNWICLTNDMMVKGVGAIGISPFNNNIVLFGGETGIMRSTNGGATFDTTGIQKSYYNNWDAWEIKWSPVDSNKVFLASTDGYYISNNRGATWVKQMNGYYLEIEIHPTIPSIMYMIRRNSSSLCTYWKSTDSGQTFTQITNGTPAPVAGQTTERIEIAVTPAAPNRLYMLAPGDANGNDGGLYGVYVSNDTGNTFSFVCCGAGPGGVPDSINDPNLFTWNIKGQETGGQIWYDVAFAANPYLADDIYMGGVNIWKSTNGGAKWRCSSHWVIGNNPQSYVHADLHDIKIYGNKIWAVSDGGIFLSTDTGANFVDKTAGIQGTEFWGMGAGFKDGDVMVGGTVHNGTIIKDGTTYNDWLPYMGGDAWNGYVAFGDNKILYADYAGGDYHRIELPNDASVFPDRTVIGTKYDESSGIEFDPRCYNTLFQITDDTLRVSEDQGRTWKKRGAVAVGTVSTLRVFYANPNIMYACNAEASPRKVFRTNDGGYTWTNITGVLSSAYNFPRLNAIAIDDRDAAKVWIVCGSFQNTQKVFKSVDSGATWVNITGTLTSDNAYCITHQRGSNGALYLGTDLGVYYRNDNMTDWMPYSTDLPISRSIGLQVMYRDNKLKNFTRGRGAWETDLFEQFPPVAQIAADKLRAFCVTDTIKFVDHSAHNSNGATWQWSFPGGVPSSSTLENPMVQYQAPGQYSVMLTVSDVNGTSTQTINNLITIENLCGGPDTIPGLALNLDGYGDYANFEPLNITTNNMTIMAWVKPTGLQMGAAPVLMQEEEPTGINFDDYNGLRTHWNGDYWWWNSGLTVDSSVWSHVALVVTPDSLTLYVNGVGSTYVDNIPAVNFNKKIRFGHDERYWNARYYKGDMDEVAIYDHALSLDEIREKMHLTKLEGEAGLMAYYQFNDETNGIIFDKAGSRDAEMAGDARRVISTGPFAGGTSARLTLAGNTPYTFANTGVTLNTAANSPNGEVVVSKLNWHPDQSPDCANYQSDDHYWILDNYGANATFTQPTQLTLGGIEVPNTGTVPANTYTLYKRGNNADGNTWGSSVASPNTATAGANGSFQFGGTNAVTSSCQLIVTNNKNVTEATLCQGDSIYAGGAWQFTSGSFYDSVYVSPTCSQISYTNVTVSPLPSVPTISQASFVLTSSSTTNNQWLIEGNPIIGETGQTISPVTSGNYSVMVSNAAGCSTVSAPINFIYNVGLNNVAEPAAVINLYPNPATDRCVLESSKAVSKIYVRDIAGRVTNAMVTYTSPNKVEIELSKLSKGVYFIEILGNSDNLIRVKKLVKQ